MNERLVVSDLDYLPKLELPFLQIFESVIRGLGERHVALYTATLKQENHVLLQDVVVGESFLPTFENMDVMDSCMRQDKLTEWFVVGPVRKTVALERLPQAQSICRE